MHTDRAMLWLMRLSITSVLLGIIFFLLGMMMAVPGLLQIIPALQGSLLGSVVQLTGSSETESAKYLFLSSMLLITGGACIDVWRRLHHKS